MKRYILIAILVLLAGLFAFHFIAANQAEKQIDNTIQMQADSAGTALSVQYSSIEVSPFSGDVEFSDITVVQGNNIERSSELMVDLRYLDFLNIYIGGLEYGLEKLYAADLHLEKPTYLNRQTMQEYSMAAAEINYTGNMLDGIRTVFAGQPQDRRHQIDIAGTQLRYSRPNPIIGTYRSDSVFLHLEYPKAGTEDTATSNVLEFKNIIWSPPSRIQKKYGFFIQGFGYPLDALPVPSVRFSFSDINRDEIAVSNGSAETDLFTMQFKGTVLRKTTWAEARLAPLTLSMVELSDQFENVLSNVEQLLGIDIPKKEDRIGFQLRGPVVNPRISGSN
jgi:hypothetical protein